ncbi:MAG: VWA domain-containing protein, partial [Bacteroidales bacterium]
MVPWTPTKSDDDPAPTSVSQCTTSRRRYFPAQGFTLLALLVGMSTASLVWHAGAVVSAQGSPVFKARTEIVRLDVSITDGSGRPVADVNPEEIEVVENGQPRPVVLFRHVREAASEELQHGPAFEEVSANGGMTAGRLYVLVFDQAHITARNEQRVRQAAEKFLLHTVKPGDGVAIYALPGPGPMLAFTSDFIKARLRLLDVKGLGGRPAPGPREYDAYRLERGDARIAGDPTQAGTADVVSEETQRAMASQVVASADTETHLFLRSLAQALGSFRSIEGRKSVIVFSEGFVSDNVTPELEQVASAAALSQSLVYGVDLNRPGVDDQRSVAETTEKRDALRRLASETNGMLFANAGDLDASLSSVAAQANDYYLVGFEPARAAVPNEYHRIDVRVSRRGLVAHARSGYSTLAAVSPATDRQAIDAALTVPRTSSALPIEYTTYERGGSTADKPRIIASVTAHVPRVGSADRQVDVVFVVRDAANGRVAASGSDRTRVQPVAGDAPGALDLVPYSVQFDVPPGEY